MSLIKVYKEGQEYYNCSDAPLLGYNNEKLRNCSQYLFNDSNLLLINDNPFNIAIDLSIHYKIAKLKEMGYTHIKPKIIHFENSFHGNQGFASLCNTNKFPFSYPYYETLSFASPIANYPLMEKKLFALRESEDFILGQINSYLKRNYLFIAAIIIEPIQITNFNIFREHFLGGLKDLCKQYNVMLIFDHTHLKTFRFGEFIYDSLCSIIPDISLHDFEGHFNGIQINQKDIKTNLSVTQVPDYQKDYFSQMVSSLNLEKINDLGNYFLKRLNLLGNRYISLISNIRGKGLLVAFDVNRQIHFDKLEIFLKENHILLKKLTFPTFCFYPPAVITKDDIDQILELFEGSLKKVTSK